MDSSPSDFGSGFERDNLDSVITGFNDENIVGEGATCRVYRMRLNGIQVAVKRLKSEYRTSPIHVAAYRKEFLIGLRLKHDSLPVYRDFKESCDEVFIIMDYIDGVSLEDFVNTPEGKSHFSSVENVRRFFRELLNIVAYLHRSGVVHCDIKPSNIMLRHYDRGVMLLDLDKSYSDTLDQTSGGTPSYSAPISQGEKPTAQKDFAAIGHVVDYLIANVPKLPKYRIKRFHKECLSKNPTPDSLLQKLQLNIGRRLWRVAAMVLLMISIGLIVEKGNITKTSSSENSNDSIPITPQEQTLVEEADQKHGIEESKKNTSQITHNAEDSSIRNRNGKINSESSSITIEPPSTTGKDVAHNNTIEADPQRKFRMPTEEGSREYVSQELLAMDLDIDVEMAEIIKEMNSTIAVIQNPDISYQECKTLVNTVSRKELRAFHLAIDKCRRLYPDIPEFDIETELTRRMDYSQVSKVFQAMHKALRERAKAEISDYNIQ